MLIKVLFVCLGNICRSPMAEAIFRDLVEKEELLDKIQVDSAGTGHWHVGEPPHEGTQKILNKFKVSYEGIKARQVRKEDVSQFDYIIAMDADNLGNLKRLAGIEETGFIGRLLDFVDESKYKDVPDPYFTGNFDEVYELVLKGCQKLLEKIKIEHQL